MKLTVFLPLFPAALALPCGAQTRVSANYQLPTRRRERGPRRRARRRRGLHQRRQRRRHRRHLHRGRSGGNGNGQLYEVTTLQLAATPATVNEGATRQINASQLLDDSTTIPLNVTAVTWGVQSGPVISVSTTGIATAGAVFQDTAAVVQGLFAGLTGTLNLTVVNTNPDLQSCIGWCVHFAGG